MFEHFVVRGFVINMAGCLLSDVITMIISLDFLEFVDIQDSVDLFFITTCVLPIFGICYM